MYKGKLGSKSKQEKRERNKEKGRKKEEKKHGRERKRWVRERKKVREVGGGRRKVRKGWKKE